MTNTLFEISEDIRALEALVTEVDGDVSEEETEAAIDEWFRENQSRLESKLEDYCWLIKEREHRGTARKAEERRLRDLRLTDERLVDRLKQRLKLFFQTTGRSKAETTSFKLWIQSNSSRSLWFNDDMPPERLPEVYQLTQIIPNMDMIRADAEEYERLRSLESPSGEEQGIMQVLGDRLDGVAHLNPPGSHLRIK